MIIIEKNAGQKITYKQTSTVISFAGGELSLNCASYQRDWAIHLDICSNPDGNLVIGTETGLNYVAQLDIPACEYIYNEPAKTPFTNLDKGGIGEMERLKVDPPTPIPLDMKKVTLTLWAIGA
ncbi:MAG: hypothetical protein RR365_02270 [Bacteroides sp.]